MPMMGYSWNHPLSAVLHTLLKNELTLEDFQEYDYSPYACFPNIIKMKKGYQVKGLEGKLPMVYSIVARKN